MYSWYVQICETYKENQHPSNTIYSDSCEKLQNISLTGTHDQITV